MIFDEFELALVFVNFRQQLPVWLEIEFDMPAAKEMKSLPDFLKTANHWIAPILWIDIIQSRHRPAALCSLKRWQLFRPAARPAAQSCRGR